MGDGTIAYNQILDKMIAIIPSHRVNMKQNAPSIIQMSIDKGLVRLIIGNRGETIKTICEVSGARVDIDSHLGVVNIFGPNRKAVEKAKEIIDDLILQPEVGKIYEGNVDKVTDFGIFVKFLSEKIRGLVHERNCDGDKYDFYTRKKLLKSGDILYVKVIFVSSDGKVGLSIADDSEIRTFLDKKGSSSNGFESNGAGGPSGFGSNITIMANALEPDAIQSQEKRDVVSHIIKEQLDKLSDDESGLNSTLDNQVYTQEKDATSEDEDDICKILNFDRSIDSDDRVMQSNAADKINHNSSHEKFKFF